MNFMKKNGIGILLCLVIAIPAWFLGKLFPVIGGSGTGNHCRNDHYNDLE